MQSNLV